MSELKRYELIDMWTSQKFNQHDEVYLCDDVDNRVCDCDFVNRDVKAAKALGYNYCHHCGGKIKEVDDG